MVRPLLGDIELQQVQKIETEADQTFTQHSIPALEGDFFQGLGRRNTWVKLSGVLTGAEVQTGLKDLRDKFREAQPVDFIADIATATQVNQVVIEEMGVRELAGKPERFEYAFTLREYIPAPVPPQEPPPPIPPRLDPVTATLIVEVIVEGEPTFDFSKVTVTVQGTQDEDNTTLDRTLTNRANNIWTEADFPSGNYTARAIVSSEPELPPGSATAVVQSGQTTQVTITLRRNPQRPTNVAKKFVVHFWFDKAFVEPCMRHVLRQVADYASHHADEKMLIVGNTDKVGPDNYNLSLGDRRARSVYAYLTSGRDQPGALAEWNLLRRPQDGQPRTVKDNWNVRQYQYILQTLGFYPGNIKDTHDALTTQGVRDFQTAKSLPPTGVVNDATWEKLIEAYLSLDPQAVADAQFFRNCGDEPLKWVSCGEQHTLDTPIDDCAPELAWRPNRRTEILFVRADRLPRPEPIPVTFNIPGSPPVGSDWCVGSKAPDPQGTARRCDFLKQKCSTAPAPDEWCVEPVEPGSITVSGSITDENGNSLGEIKYVLIAPDGKFMDGERKCGPDRGRPIKGKTAIDGTFAYKDQSSIGVYTMEVELPHPPQVAHAKTKPPATGRGSVVCKRLDSGDTVFDVIIRSGTPSQFAVNPLITLTSAIVVVKKSYTNPARQLVTLKTDAEFIGAGTLERSNNAIRFFTAATGNTEITFNGTDNVFDGAQLTAGVPLFAEGATPSTTIDDVQLTLTLSSVDLLVGPPKTATMTAVELTLEIGDRRSAPGVDPVPLSAAAKINPGRFLEVRNATNTHERALLIVRQANPAVFTGDLELNAIGNKVQIFAEADEVPAAGQTALTKPQVIPNGTIPADGVKFWAEGVTASTALRDTGFQLGIKDVERDGDRVAVTVFALAQLDAIKFNHNPNSANDNAFNLRRNFQQFLSVPEWQQGVSVSPNDSVAAYAIRETQGNQITIQAKFRGMGLQGRTVEVRAIANSSSVLGEVSARQVTFLSNGETNFETFELQNVQIANIGVGIHTFTWQWQFRIAPTQAWINIGTSSHKIYTVLELPKAAWQQAPYVPNNTQLPWTEVLEVACSWAVGARTLDAAATRVTQSVYNLGPTILQYDCQLGATQYSSPRFNCSAFLNRLRGGVGLGLFVNCTDCATIVSTFANILGCDLWQSQMGNDFAVNPILAIGSSAWQPACTWGGFRYHEVAWKGGCTVNDEVFDACLLVDGDADPTTPPQTPLLPANLRFGNSGSGLYRDRLAAPAGRANCQPQPNTRQRRQII